MFAVENPIFLTLCLKYTTSRDHLKYTRCIVGRKVLSVIQDDLILDSNMRLYQKWVTIRLFYHTVIKLESSRPPEALKV